MQKLFSHLGEMEEYRVKPRSQVAKDCFQTIQRHQEPVTMTHNINKQKKDQQRNKTNEQASLRGDSEL